MNFGKVNVGGDNWQEKNYKYVYCKNVIIFT